MIPIDDDAKHDGLTPGARVARRAVSAGAPHA
jgi:hypothetical protein